MGSIGGVKKEEKDFTKKVGVFEATVVCINPTAEEYTTLIGELKEDSKETEYLGTSRDNNISLRIKIWLQSKDGSKFPLTFFLEDKQRENKDGTKVQYINAVGNTAWAEDENSLRTLASESNPNEGYRKMMNEFVKREFRVAYFGEEALYNFLHSWLGKLDYYNVETTLEIEWKKLMKGNVKDLKDQVDGEWCTPVGALATIDTTEKEGEIKEYQGVYNKAFLPAFSLKFFRLIDYTKPEVIAALSVKKSRDLKSHERFILNVIDGEHGCKNYYVLKELQDYEAGDNLVASDKPISTEGSDY